MKNFANAVPATAEEKRINNLVEKYHLVFNKKTNLYDCKRSVEVGSDLVENGKLKIKFGVVKGNFIVNMPLNTLASLEGVPQSVGKDFIIEKAYSLTSLIGSPKKVGRDFVVINCDSLKSLEGAPQKVGMDFTCLSCSHLQSLKGAPQKVGGNFNCSFCNHLKSLEGAPKEIGGLFYCFNCNSLKSLNGVPREIVFGVDISECENIESSDGIPCDMGGNNNRSNQTNDEQTNVQEKERHTCCICGKEFEGYGNNASPVMDNGCCCDECNRNVVKPARILSEAHSIEENSRLKETDVEKVMVYPAKKVLTEEELNNCHRDPSSAYNACFNTLVREGTSYVEGYIPYNGGRLMLPFAVNKTPDGRYFDSSLAQKEPFEFFVKREYTKEEIFNIHGTARMSFLTIGDDWKILQPSSTCEQMRKAS